MIKNVPHLLGNVFFLIKTFLASLFLKSFQVPNLHKKSTSLFIKLVFRNI